MSHVRKIFVDWFKRASEACAGAASPGMTKELARREAERGKDTFRWFTPPDAATAEALARIIVPSDQETPGIDEVSVLDPPAMVTLDRLIATSPDRQYVYSRGLLSFDVWALKRHQRKFAELAQGDQIVLFKAAQHLHERQSGRISATKKAWRRLRALAQVGKGTYFAAQLYPQIRNDCLQVYYTSRVSWVWLEYDGPPMDKGYSSLVEPR